MKLHYAKVIENNDPKFLGRVKIKVDSIMDSLSDDMCPWASLFMFSMGGMTATQSATPFGSLKVPVVGSLVWVFFQDEVAYKHPMYVADVSLPLMHTARTIFLEAAKVIMNAWTLAPSGIDGTYPMLHYTMYPSGMIIGIGIDSVKEMFVYHSPTSFITINNDGAINVSGTDVMIGGTTTTTMSTLSGSAITMDATSITVSNIAGSKVEVTPTDVTLQTAAGDTLSASASGITISNAAGTGTITMNAVGVLEIKGLTVQIDGTTNLVAPTGSGGFCSLPACLFTGALHTGNKIS